MKQNKYNRSNYYNKIKIENKLEYDLSNSYSNLFKVTQPIRYYQITKYEAFRPDIISRNIYGTIDHWWILMRFNDIVDIFTELKEGFILKVPSINDIQKFNKAIREALKEEAKLKNNI